MDLVRAKQIRSYIDFYPEYTILEDIHIEDGELLIKVRIRIDSGSKYVPQMSDWYIVFESESDFYFFPANENSISVTFPHQSYNEKIKSKSYRSGKPCLDIPEFILDLPESYYPYSKGESIFCWYLERMLDWLQNAVTNSLLQKDEPFEVPINSFIGNELIYKEVEEPKWLLDGDNSFGYVYLRAWSTGQINYYVLYELYDQNFNNIDRSQWGDVSWQFVDINQNAIWIKCNQFPIREPWEYPSSWEELFSICRTQGIEAFRIIVSLLWGKNCNDQIKLLLACPIPKKFGASSKNCFWLMCDMPPIYFPRKGFRASKAGLESSLKYVLRGKINWHKTNNWDDSIIRTRGMVEKSWKNLSYAIIGAGALGGYVCEMLVRQGIINIKIIDGDNVVIGNLSRHILTLNDLNKNKANALAERIASISPSVKTISVATQLDLININCLDNSDIIIDCTANNELLGILETHVFEKEKIFFIGGFNYGASGFAYTKQIGRRLNTSKFYERTEKFYNSALKSIKENGILMEGIGCYHPVFPAMDSDVILWAAVFVKEILNELNSTNGIIKAFRQTDSGAIEVVINETI